jgi:hypothetical protein
MCILVLRWMRRRGFMVEHLAKVAAICPGATGVFPARNIKNNQLCGLFAGSLCISSGQYIIDHRTHFIRDGVDALELAKF